METFVELEEDFKQLAAAGLGLGSNDHSRPTTGAAYSFCSWMRLERSSMRSSSRIKASLSSSCLVNFIFNLAYFFLENTVSLIFHPPSLSGRRT